MPGNKESKRSTTNILNQQPKSSLERLVVYDVKGNCYKKYPPEMGDKKCKKVYINKKQSVYNI
jgi:hypothetical protein